MSAHTEKLQKDNQTRLARIDRRIEFLLANERFISGFRCFTVASCQAAKQIDGERWLRGPEIKQIQKRCKDECCNPRAKVRGYLEYERERLSKHDNLEKHTRVPIEPQECPGSPPLDNLPDTSATAASSCHVPNTDATPEAATEHSQMSEASTAIPEATTEQSKIKLLRKLANAATSEAATAIPEAKRQKKSTPTLSKPVLPDTSAIAGSSCRVPDRDASPASEDTTTIPEAKRQRKSTPTVSKPDLQDTSAIPGTSCRVPDGDATPDAATPTPEAVTEHSEIQLANRPRKSGKGTFPYKEPKRQEATTSRKMKTGKGKMLQSEAKEEERPQPLLQSMACSEQALSTATERAS